MAAKSDLVSIHSATENAFVTALASSHFEPIASIGLRELSGKYAWTDGSKVAFTNLENKTATTNDQECTILTTVGNGQWERVSCNTVQFAYVCKKAPKA